MNLIPAAGPLTGSYFCTWRTQATTLRDLSQTCDVVNLRDRIDEDYLFGTPGVLSNYMEEARGDLIVVLDDGWDVPYHTDASVSVHLFGSLEPDPERFPFAHGTPAERLKQLSDRVKSLGYRGLGLWIACQMPFTPGAPAETPEEARAFWKERAAWCHEAGVLYWKVDWGRCCGSVEYRAMMTEAVREAAPELMVEHALCQGPIDKPYTERLADKDRAGKLSALLRHADFVRAYDVVGEFRYSTMFARTAELLIASKGTRGTINIEDPVQIGAALGCSLGIMRHPIEEERPDIPRSIVTPFTDAVRALRWQRIMPPFAADACEYRISDEIVTDRYEYPVPEVDAWPHLGGKTVEQTTPLVISRVLPLPVVSGADVLPLVGAAKHPENGAAAVGTFPRTFGGRLNRHIPADVSIEDLSADAPVGVFGFYRSLSLTFDKAVEGKRVYAQDLAADEAVDVTDSVVLSGNRLTLPGSLIEQIGLSAARDRDSETPGLMLRLF